MRENIVESRGGSFKDIVVPIAENTKALTVYKCISLLVTPRATLSRKRRGYPSKRLGCYTRIGIST
jgi:hypothetical protein